MANYMFIYKGEATPMEEMTPEQGAEVMAKWTAWMEQVGDALVDVGAPFGSGTSCVDDGSSTAAAAATGYSIVSAADLDAAKSLTNGHPYLSEGLGNFAIDIYELAPVPFEA